jgi:hypothetical protein
LEYAHVLLLDLHGTIIEWVCGMLASGNGDDHIWGQDSSVRSFNTLWRYAKNLTHELKFVFVCKYTLFFELYAIRIELFIKMHDIDTYLGV